MGITRILTPLGALAVVAAAPAAGVAPGIGVQSAETRISISGVVPVVCHARVEASLTASLSGVQQLGELREFCNSPRGYRVVANYSPSLTHAKLLVDGKPVPLGPQGEVVVSRSNRAAMASHSVALDLGPKAAPGSISFRIEPL